MSILARLKANIVPAMAVFIVPFGYFYGIQLRKDSDAKEIQAKWQQQSEEERMERLRKQRAALLEEPTKDYLVLHRTGDKMPLVGYGTWKITDEEAEGTIFQAIKAGYRLIDTAAVYHNERGIGRGIGRGIAKAINEGIVTREDLFVVTKLPNAYHAKENVRPIFQKQLGALGLEYIDLYHIHWPLPLEKTKDFYTYPPPEFVGSDGVLRFERGSSLHNCYREIEKLVNQGFIRNIGISNFNVQLIMDLLTYCDIKPSVLQVELHPYLQQKRLVQWVQSQGIQVTAYSSMGSTAYDDFSVQGKALIGLLEHDTIKKIAQKHEKSTGQVLLRWSIERPVAVIPKSAIVERMKSNRDLFTWSLDDEDRKLISNMDLHFRFNELTDELCGFDCPIFD
ncbi:NADP-dependent oxidoreductase domain-containing protein [Phascolomyces articulosus]|uniref:NADP-dependent oxidoreductase domain-containing protein n=1 Tax=Phascolomyces articulosus TaxID=60185 RepID=A0AAD5PDH5_9FUNG|nr:NADP-dependent oxidoreductase domain-containing protein [Phascolomyces articulosus]